MKTTNVNGVAAPPTEQLPAMSAWERELAELGARTPEEILADRARVEQASRPPRPLPPGMTLEEAVQGLWPGDDSDEEILRALERLS